MTKSAPDERRVESQKPLPKIRPAANTIPSKEQPQRAKTELEILDGLIGQQQLSALVTRNRHAVDVGTYSDYSTFGHR